MDRVTISIAEIRSFEKDPSQRIGQAIVNKYSKRDYKEVPQTELSDECVLFYLSNDQFWSRYFEWIDIDWSIK